MTPHRSRFTDTAIKAASSRLRAWGAFCGVWLSIFALRSSWTVEDTLFNSILIPAFLQERAMNVGTIPFVFDLLRPDDLCFVKDASGRILPVHPVGMLVFAAPIQVTLWIAAWMSGASVDVTTTDFIQTRFLVEKLSASLLTTLSVFYLHFTLVMFVPYRTSIALSALYTFGSSSLSTLSQGLWPHTGINLILIYLAYSLLRENAVMTRARECIFFGALGMLCSIRPTAIPFAAIFGLAYLIRFGCPRLGSFFAGLLTIIPTLWWNLALFQHVLGGYTHFAHRRIDIQPTHILSRLQLILFSPYRGLLIFNPFLIFSLWSYKPLRALPTHRRTIFVALGSCILCHYFLCSTNPEWHGGYTFGPRYMLDVLAPSFLIAGIGYNSVLSRFPKLTDTITVLIVVLSVALHMFGVLGDRLPLVALNDLYRRLLVPQ